MQSSLDKEIDKLNEFRGDLTKHANKLKKNMGMDKYKNLTDIEIGIINILFKNDKVILKEISEELEIPKSTLTSALDRLEKKNYVLRIISSRDRRSYGLKLTKEGEEVHMEYANYEKIFCEKILNAIDEEYEKLMLFKLLNKINNNLQK